VFLHSVSGSDCDVAYCSYVSPAEAKTLIFLRFDVVNRNTALQLKLGIRRCRFLALLLLFTMCGMSSAFQYAFHLSSLNLICFAKVEIPKHTWFCVTPHFLPTFKSCLPPPNKKKTIFAIVEKSERVVFFVFRIIENNFRYIKIKRKENLFCNSFAAAFFLWIT